MQIFLVDDNLQQIYHAIVSEMIAFLKLPSDMRWIMTGNFFLRESFFVLEEN